MHRCVCVCVRVLVCEQTHVRDTNMFFRACLYHLSSVAACHSDGIWFCCPCHLPLQITPTVRDRLGDLLGPPLRPADAASKGPGKGASRNRTPAPARNVAALRAGASPTGRSGAAGGGGGYDSDDSNEYEECDEYEAESEEDEGGDDDA